MTFDRSADLRPTASPSWPSVLVLAMLFAVMGVGCSPKDSHAPARKADNKRSNHRHKSGASPLLVDVSGAAGIDFVHDAFRRGEFLFPEISGAGCGFLDYNNDGYLDIYFVQSGRNLRDPDSPAKPNRLYRNRRDGTFEDVTQVSGAGDTGYGQGLACGDYNNDGFVDLYVANVGGPSVLLRNNGNGTFTDDTQRAGVANGLWAIAPAFFDYDNDGLLDLFATNYVDWSVENNVTGHTKSGQLDYTGPRSFPALSAILYHNNGDGTFTDVTRSAGIDRAFGAGMGIICADLNDDDLVDAYVANDSWANQLWLNQGNGTFDDRALECGCAVSGSGLGQASMGTNAEDLDGDGKLDLFTTNYYAQGSILYLQGANGIFSDASMRVGLFGLTAARTGFGACFFDLFNDGAMCVYIGNGAAVLGGETHASGSGYSQQDMVLRWSPSSNSFADISGQIGAALDRVYTSRGVAVGDYDNDGAMDVLVSSNNGPARLLRNSAAGGNHWLMVRCLDRDGKRDAIGAKVFVTVDGKTRRRDVIVNYSYASACDPRVHFGLGHDSVAQRIVVRWPGGVEAKWEDVPADQVFLARHPVSD